MKTHLINYEDLGYLGYHKGYLQKLPQYIEAYKITLDLVPAAEYGKYREPAMDRIVVLANQASTEWGHTAARFRAVHERTRQTLGEAIALLETPATPAALLKAKAEVLKCAADFRQQQIECQQVLQRTAAVIPRFMDFMNRKAFEYASRHNLLIQVTQASVPASLKTAMSDERNLTSARATVEHHQRCYNTAMLTAANVGAYSARLAGLLNATGQQLGALDTRSSDRRAQVLRQSVASSAREAKRLIDHTFRNILIYRI